MADFLSIRESNEGDFVDGVGVEPKYIIECRCKDGFECSHYFYSDGGLVGYVCDVMLGERGVEFVNKLEGEIGGFFDLEM